jgi:hypothetical protein
MDPLLSLSPDVAGGEHSRMTDEQISRIFIICGILSTKYLTSTIARDLKSLEAISFGVGRALEYTSCPSIKVADCFGIKLLAMTGQGYPG